MSEVDELLSNPWFEEIGLLLTRALVAMELGDEAAANSLRETMFVQAAELCPDRSLVAEALRARAQGLREMAYADYLQTRHWRQMRRLAIERALDMCQVCSEIRNLQVHHRTYADRGNELLADLTVLCATCHEMFHKHRRLNRGGGE